MLVDSLASLDVTYFCRDIQCEKASSEGDGGEPTRQGIKER
jgi:hypothetical protein